MSETPLKLLLQPQEAYNHHYETVRNWIRSFLPLFKESFGNEKLAQSLLHNIAFICFSFSYNLIGYFEWSSKSDWLFCLSATFSLVGKKDAI